MQQLQQYQSQPLLQLLQRLQTTGYRHTTITPLSHATVNARIDNAWASDLNGIFGWSRPFQRELLDDYLFELMQQCGLVLPAGDGWRSALRVSSMDQRLFLHSAFPTDAQDAVFFGPDTYRYVQAIHAHLANHTAAIQEAVDICCGAGPGALAIASLCPQAQVWATDINALALQLTEINATAAGIGNVTTLYSDLLQALPAKLDLVCANPPYLLDPQQRAYRHGGGEWGAGLALSIIEQALPRLRQDGSLVLYTGVAMVAGQDPFLQAASQRIDPSLFNMDYREMDPDVFGEELQYPAYSGADRIAAVVLTATRRA